MARTSPWPAVLGTAALMALPVLAAAQSGQASSAGSQPSQTPKAQSDTKYPVGSGAATHHLTEAKMVLEGIPRNAVTGPNAAKIAEIRREFAALQRSYEADPSIAPDAKSSSSRSSKGSAGDWNTRLMKLDRELAALLGPGSDVAGSQTGMTGSTSATGTETAGTSGSTSSSASRPTADASSASSSLDPNVRSQLEEFRKHITQFAAAASGTGAGGEMSSSESTSSTTAAAGSTTPTEPAETTASSSSSQSNPTSASSQTGSATGETQTQTGQTTGTSGAQVDASAARQHLTEARQSLADLTALPQAQQLQGDTRTQVSQLISQFNQLITTQDDWRSAYDQVNATLNTLLNSSPSASSSSGTQGSVGTSGSASASGSATIDPAIRTKLEEFRTHLQAFYTAAGGEAGAGGPSGSTSSSSAAGSTASGSAEAESHIAAIERILDQAGAGSSSSSSTSGTSGSTTGTATGSTSGATGSTSTTGTSTTPSTSGSSVTLTPQQIEQIRTHLQQLRTAIRK